AVMIWMGWTRSGLGAQGVLGAPGGRGGGAGYGTGVGAGGHEWGTREAALPGKWRAFLLVLVVMALIGVVILLTAYLSHERVVRRRLAWRVRAEARAKAQARARAAVAVGDAGAGRGRTAAAGTGVGGGRRRGR